MKIKKAQYKEVMRKTQVIVKDEVYGCDECRKPINRGGEQRQYLQATVFKHNVEARHLEFCAWKCALKGLSKVKTDYFIGLPYLHYDDHQHGIRAKDFFDAIKAFK